MKSSIPGLKNRTKSLQSEFSTVENAYPLWANTAVINRRNLTVSPCMIGRLRSYVMPSRIVDWARNRGSRGWPQGRSDSDRTKRLAQPLKPHGHTQPKSMPTGSSDAKIIIFVIESRRRFATVSFTSSCRDAGSNRKRRQEHQLVALRAGGRTACATTANNNMTCNAVKKSQGTRFTNLGHMYWHWERRPAEWGQPRKGPTAAPGRLRASSSLSKVYLPPWQHLARPKSATSSSLVHRRRSRRRMASPSSPLLACDTLETT